MVHSDKGYQTIYICDYKAYAQKNNNGGQIDGEIINGCFSSITLKYCFLNYMNFFAKQ